MIRNCCINNKQNGILKIYKQTILNIYNNSNICIGIPKNRYYGKSRNLFDDDDDDDQGGSGGQVIDKSQRDFEYRMKNNQPFRGKYHSSVVDSLTKPKQFKKKDVLFTDEDMRIILEHELSIEKNSQRNIFVENIQEEEISSIRPVTLPSKDVIEDDKFSYSDITDQGFELLLMEIFKNKQTGECDLDEEDLLEIRKMLVASTSPNVLNVLESNKHNNNNNNSNSDNSNNNK